jgi:hypothetical protein
MRSNMLGQVADCIRNSRAPLLGVSMRDVMVWPAFKGASSDFT